MDENKNSWLFDFVERNYDLIKKLEIISFTIFVIGFLLIESNVPDSKIILVIGIIATGIFLYLQAFKMIKFDDSESSNVLGKTGFINFIYRIYYFSLTASVFSLLGLIIEFRNGNPFVKVGGSTLIIILILVFFSKIQEKSKVYDFKFYLRIIICFFFLWILLAEKGL